MQNQNNIPQTYLTAQHPKGVLIDKAKAVIESSFAQTNTVLSGIPEFLDSAHGLKAPLKCEVGVNR